MKTFKHSGDIGDLIYALPTIRALGGGRLVLSRSDLTRVPMSQETLFNVQSLLEKQSYIETVSMWDETLDPLYDLDQWREGWGTRDNIAAQHLKTFGLLVAKLDRPWLEVPPKSDTYNCYLPKVIINRTTRHQNPLFPWNKVVSEYWPHVDFVGSLEEHKAFVTQFGAVPYLITPTLLNLAQAIAGSQLFIGNQSAAYAIAEGLKKPVIQEVFLETPNCIFERPGAQFVRGSEIELPELA